MRNPARCVLQSVSNVKLTRHRIPLEYAEKGGYSSYTPILAVTALFGWWQTIYTDGILDLHYGLPAPLWVFLVQGPINWLLLAILLLVTGRWLSQTRFRTLDLLGTQALARWPMLIAMLVMALPAFRNPTESILARLADVPLQEQGQVMADTQFLIDAMVLLGLSLPLMAALAWMIWLMYHSYSLVCNIRGARAIFSFIAMLLLAEVLSKLIYWMLFRAVLPSV